jgi:L-threonylcarbamoyladenylate synthase
MKVLSIDPGHPQADLLEQAARAVREGGLVAFPTETVYGLAADAANPSAIQRLNAVKGRPPDKPYSLHVYEQAQVASLVSEVPPLAKRLMERFWPGPLTIIMAGKDGGTVGFRLPDHPVALAFLRACGRPIAAPSANPSGMAAPTDAREVLASLAGQDGGVDFVLDAGPTPLGRESTVVSVVGNRLQVLREGAIAGKELQAVA